jgi:hypothetical protein
LTQLSRRALDVFFVLLGVGGLVLKGRYSGPAQVLVHSYGGNVAASFAVYFLAKHATARRDVSRASAAALAFIVVQLFELLDGFGVLSNVFDRFDLAANTVGIAIAIALDVVVTRRSRGRSARPGMHHALSLTLLATLAVSCAHSPATGRVDSTPPPATGTSQWASVQTLRPRASIGVALFTGEQLRGSFISADDQRVRISSAGAPLEIERARVQRVTMFTGLTRRTRAGRGFLVGAVGGALLAALTVETNKGPWALMLAGGWGVVGALLGSLDGSTREATIIYEVQERRAAHKGPPCTSTSHVTRVSGGCPARRRRS